MSPLAMTDATMNGLERALIDLRNELRTQQKHNMALGSMLTKHDVIIANLADSLKEYNLSRKQSISDLAGKLQQTETRLIMVENQISHARYFGAGMLFIGSGITAAAVWLIGLWKG